MDKSSQEFVVLLMIIFSRNCLERWERNEGEERDGGERETKTDREKDFSVG